MENENDLRAAQSSQLIILLSGHVSVGKTTLAQALGNAIHTALVLSSRRVLEAALDGPPPPRDVLQRLGERLDAETNGNWLRDAVLAELGAQVLIVDAVRTRDQIDALKAAAALTLHVHLKASVEVLAARYQMRRAERPELELKSYRAVLADPTEAKVDQLGSVADLVIDAGRWSASACKAIVYLAADLLAEWPRQA